MHELPERKRMILRAVIVEYVSAAEPIASDLLSAKYDLGVKSATVRNELAEMSELGFLEQPHTSAGRIPSDKGYRFYIDNLLNWREPNVGTKNRVQDVADDGEALRLLLDQTTRALSRVTHLLSAATTIRNSKSTIRSVVVSAFGPKQALLVVGLSNGEIINKLLECPIGLTLADVGAINESLNRELVGLSLSKAQRAKTPIAEGPESRSKLTTTVWTHVRGMLRELSRGDVTTHGEEFLFGQPEFAKDATSLAGVLDELKESELLMEALHSTADTSYDVTIGKENRHPNLHRLSVVKRIFHVGSDEAGVIALIGPTRMDYDSSIPLIDFTAKALTLALSRRVE